MNTTFCAQGTIGRSEALVEALEERVVVVGGTTGAAVRWFASFKWWLCRIAGSWVAGSWVCLSWVARSWVARSWVCWRWVVLTLWSSIRRRNLKIVSVLHITGYLRSCGRSCGRSWGRSDNWRRSDGKCRRIRGRIGWRRSGVFVANTRQLWHLITSVTNQPMIDTAASSSALVCPTGVIGKAQAGSGLHIFVEWDTSMLLGDVLTIAVVVAVITATSTSATRLTVVAATILATVLAATILATVATAAVASARITCKVLHFLVFIHQPSITSILIFVMACSASGVPVG